MLSAPDGSVYFVDQLGQTGLDDALKRVTPGGTIQTITIPQRRLLGPMALEADGRLLVAIGDGGPAGLIRVDPASGATEWVARGSGGTGADYGDGGPALDATLDSITGLAVAPDGSIYVADAENCMVRKITPDRIVHTVVGVRRCDATGGDGGPARDALVNQPMGLALGPDGSLYVAESWCCSNGRIRRVSPEGIISTVAGGVGGAVGGNEGGRATETSIHPESLDIGRDGSLLFIENWAGGRIRRVTPDGTIRTVAGGGPDPAGLGDGDGGPATRAFVQQLSDARYAPDGSIYTAEWSMPRIRRVGRPFPHSADGLTTIPSADGTELYQFDASGRHRKTLAGRSGATVRTFQYDGAGRLASVTDADGQVTSIERDGDGQPTAIVAPGGQRSTVQTGAGGWLTRFEDPLGHGIGASYDRDGLMRGLTDRLGGAHAFDYDARGRLTRDAAPGGAVQTLAATPLADGERITLTSPGGLVRSFETRTLPTGTVRRLQTDHAGAQTESLSRVDETQRITRPDGTTIDRTLAPDPAGSCRRPIRARSRSAPRPGARGRRRPHAR